MATELSDDWTISHTLGEGAYGEVKLLLNKFTGDRIAMKVIDLARDNRAEVKKLVEKEIKIHTYLKDKHIIRCYGSREQSNFYYIFLEFAPGGELFNMIDPDIGMPPGMAQKYMKQLIAGVTCLHKHGIAHRDLKPENLLLDMNDNLKISDFGLAAIYRLNGKERPLEKRCGTLPYVAPEVLVRPYAGGPADVWSCGIILTAMLAGELPWDKASDDNLEYTAWRKGDYMDLTPWSKLDTISLSLVKSILNHLPSARPTPEQIADHRWLKNPVRGVVKFAGPDRKKIKTTETLSQVVPSNSVIESNTTSSFSQPAADINNLLLSTQLLATQTQTPQNCLQMLVRRMTRFYVSLDVGRAVEKLVAALERIGLDGIDSTDTVVTVTLTDRRKASLVFKAIIFDVEDGTALIDFRLSKGDGLEFKKLFVTIRSAIKPYIVRPPVDTDIELPPVE